MTAMRRALRLPPVLSRDRVVRLMITNWILGAAVGVIGAALMLWLDVAGLRRLLFRADHVTWEGLVLLFGGFAITFGGVVCASAVMGASNGHDEPHSSGGPGVADHRPRTPRSARVVVRQH